MCVIIKGKSGEIGFPRLHLRIVGLPVFGLCDMPILLGHMAALIKWIQVVTIETLFSILLGRVVSSGVRFTGILREGDEAIFFPMAWTVAGGSLVWGGRTLLP